MICHVITDLNRGGSETQLLQLVSSSSNEQLRHVVISLLPGGTLVPALRVVGIDVHTLGMSRHISGITALIRLVRLLKQLRPDVVHGWLYHGCLIGLIGARLAGVHRVIWGLRSANARLRGYNLWTRAVVRLCAMLSFLPETIVVNSTTSRQVHQRWGYKGSRMKVIGNGVDPHHFCPDPATRLAIRSELKLDEQTVLVGMVARFSPMKDHRTFLRAAGIVHRRNPSVRFLLAGENIDRENPALMRMVHESGLEQAVHMLGTRDDIPTIMGALDVACLSSWSESFPNVVVEAMSCGVPCIATDAGDAAVILEALD